MSSPKDVIIHMSADEYWREIKDDYVKQIVNSEIEIYPSNNPGPETADGQVNFECHCVGHLVASPCGFEFREAMTCQKNSSQEQLEQGACGDKLVSFMDCVTQTQCYASPSQEKTT